MSYASVAATNAPPPSQQPHPDPALLNTIPPTHDTVIDNSAKVNVVGPDFKRHPVAENVTYEPPPVIYSGGVPPTSDKRHKHRHDAKEEGLQLWETTKRYLVQPAFAGGIIGVVNIGIFGTLGYNLYKEPQLRRDTKFITSAAFGTLALLGMEGFGVDLYRQTPRGRVEEKRAKEEGALIFAYVQEQVLRPGVLGGLVGLANSVILGTVGYLAYANWDRRWDQRAVSGVTVGLLAVWGGQGWLVEKYGRK